MLRGYYLNAKGTPHYNYDLMYYFDFPSLKKKFNINKDCKYLLLTVDFQQLYDNNARMLKISKK